MTRLGDWIRETWDNWMDRRKKRKERMESIKEISDEAYWESRGKEEIKQAKIRGAEAAKPRKPGKKGKGGFLSDFARGCASMYKDQPKGKNKKAKGKQDQWGFDY